MSETLSMPILWLCLILTSHPSPLCRERWRNGECRRGLRSHNKQMPSSRGHVPSVHDKQRSSLCRMIHVLPALCAIIAVPGDVQTSPTNSGHWREREKHRRKRVESSSKLCPKVLSRSLPANMYVPATLKKYGIS